MLFKKNRRKLDKFLKKTILSLSKKNRFVLTTFILTFFIFLTQFFNPPKVFYLIFFTALIAFLLSLWCLWEELDGIEFFTLTTLPVFFTIGISLFYFLLPSRIIIRLPVILIYMVSIYAILSLENILNVAAIRTIALLRAAKTFNMIFSLISSIFLFNTALSLHLFFIFNFILVFLISFLFFLPLYWSEKLENKIEREVFVLSFVSSLILGELSVFLSFFPLKATFFSLFLATHFYILWSINQNKLNDLPLKKSNLEYIFLSLLSLFLIYSTSSWMI